MKTTMFNLGSAWRGIRAMHKTDVTPKAGWTVVWLKRWHFWCHLWTPTWHEGRGPYLSMAIGPVAIYRGY